ncbi:hypothetical protein VP01_27g5 [Puccinia sorghi]|uniref:Uncharacterized protein n=1 Tax=Puccinia sorghi TaxID=27349 RepID=A0A0L6V4C7_9BASI|nr:hypothetical protein VP01_27g5 [Puccinia sorghi]
MKKATKMATCPALTREKKAREWKYTNFIKWQQKWKIRSSNLISDFWVEGERYRRSKTVSKIAFLLRKKKCTLVVSSCRELHTPLARDLFKFANSNPLFMQASSKWLHNQVPRFPCGDRIASMKESGRGTKMAGVVFHLRYNVKSTWKRGGSVIIGKYVSTRNGTQDVSRLGDFVSQPGIEKDWETLCLNQGWNIALVKVVERNNYVRRKDLLAVAVEAHEEMDQGIFPLMSTQETVLQGQGPGNIEEKKETGGRTLLSYAVSWGKSRWVRKPVGMDEGSGSAGRNDGSGFCVLRSGENSLLRVPVLYARRETRIAVIFLPTSSNPLSSGHWAFCHLLSALCAVQASRGLTKREEGGEMFWQQGGVGDMKHDTGVNTAHCTGIVIASLHAQDNHYNRRMYGYEDLGSIYNFRDGMLVRTDYKVKYFIRVFNLCKIGIQREGVRGQERQRPQELDDTHPEEPPFTGEETSVMALLAARSQSKVLGQNLKSLIIPVNFLPFLLKQEKISVWNIVFLMNLGQKTNLELWILHNLSLGFHHSIEIQPSRLTKCQHWEFISLSTLQTLHLTLTITKGTLNLLLLFLVPTEPPKDDLFDYLQAFLLQERGTKKIKKSLTSLKGFKIDWHTTRKMTYLSPLFTFPTPVSDSPTFKYWINSAADLGKDIVHMGLQLKMESPGFINDQVTAEAEAQNLMMVERIHKANLEVLPSIFKGSVNVHGKTLQTRSMTMTYLSSLLQPQPINPLCSVIYRTLVPGVSNECKTNNSSGSGKISEMGKIVLVLLANKKKGALKKNLLNCLQLTCRNSPEASVVTPTFLQELFNQDLVHSHFAVCTVTVPKHLHMQTGGVWMTAWLKHAAFQLQAVEQVCFLDAMEFFDKPLQEKQCGGYPQEEQHHQFLILKISKHHSWSNELLGIITTQSIDNVSKYEQHLQKRYLLSIKKKINKETLASPIFNFILLLFDFLTVPFFRKKIQQSNFCFSNVLCLLISPHDHEEKKKKKRKKKGKKEKIVASAGEIHGTRYAM